MAPTKKLALEVERVCEYVPKETIEICVNKEDDEWARAVFLEQTSTNKNEKNAKYMVQILNQDQIMSVGLDSIRKFKGCNDKAMFMNIVTLSMGAGIFSMPWALAGSSIIPGLILMLLSMVFVFYTCGQVLDSADRYNYDNMGKILEKELEDYPFLSQAFKILATATCWISTILCLISYYCIIYENGASMVPKDSQFKPFYWFILGPCITSALTLLPNRMLSWTSFVSLIVTIMVVIALLVEIGQKGVYKLGKVHIFSIGRGYFCIIANMMMSMSIQYNMPSLYKEVQIRDVKRTKQIMAYAFTTVYAIFSMTVVLAYILFGPNISEDFLEDLENTPFGMLVKASAMLVCLCVAPLCVLPITDDIELWILAYKNKNKSIGQKVIEEKSEEDSENQKSMGMQVILQLIKIFAIVFPVLLAWTFKVQLKLDLGTVNVWNGIVVLFCYCAITPLVVAPKLDTKVYVLCTIAFIITILAIAFPENHKSDLDTITPYW